MTNLLYPWQLDAWSRLQQLRARMPHAILFHGANGIGKTTFVERFAQALLCQATLPDGQPCGKCAACGWVDQYAHPDFRRVRPEALEDDGTDVDDDGTDASAGKKGGKSAKTPSKEIKIDQIRPLADFVNISTHRQGLRVIVLYPAEALNVPAANALLKTLEEPPAETVFLLVSNSLDRLLPTILSRCRKFSLGAPSRKDALAWLSNQGVEDADLWLSEQGGAPLAALEQAQSDIRDTMDEFLRQLMRPSLDGALKTADKFQKTAVSDLVSWLQRWQYDMFSHKLCGTVRYFPRYGKELADLAARVETRMLLAAIKATSERRAISEHPLSAKLFIEDMLLDYSTLFSGNR